MQTELEALKRQVHKLEYHREKLEGRLNNIERVLRMDALTATKLDHPEGRSVNGIFSVPATANS
jgi:hypothetical protein